ncbi:MAG: hypothetical protein IJU55_03090 [Selenomonadaceae bacterium]|nr:hypothetical protein [Selenomonadaceae bacterium]
MLEIKNIFDLQRFSYIINTTAGTVLSGSGDADYISNSSANTVQIYAAAGNDTIYSYYSYYTTIDGGAGNDSVSLSSSNYYNTIDAGSGNDTIEGSYVYYSTVNGGEGTDIMNLSGGYSSFVGGSGNDIISLTSYSYDNTINGGTGNDTIYGYDDESNNGQIYQYANGDGYDVIYNYSMADTVSITSGYYSTSVSGNNVIIYAYNNIRATSPNGAITLAGAAVKPFNIKGSFNIYPNEDVITNTNSSAVVIGTSGNDSIHNDDGDNVQIYAEAGNDSIYNSEGYRDTIYGEAGNDTIYNHSADYSFIDGGAGNDYIYNDSNSYNVTIKGDSGNDTVYTDGSYASIDGGAGADSVFSSSYRAKIDGGADNDTITSSGSYSMIDAGAGNDRISLGSYTYNNFVKGGTGNDTIFGDVSSSSYGNFYQYAIGDGNDLIYSYRSVDKVSIGGDSNSYTQSTVGSDVVISVNSSGAITLKGAAGKDISILDNSTPYIAVSNSSIAVNGTSGNDTIENSGYYSYVTINAGAGNDSVIGYASRGVINGDAGNDTIATSSGDYASINGGAGNDIVSLSSSSIWSNTIKGGTGNDTIYGTERTSYGHTYQYANGDGYDVINGYGSADTITFTSGYYSMSTVGSNVILKAYKTSSSSANGAITLVGAAGETINVKGDSIKGGDGDDDTNSWTISGTTAKYGTSDKTLVTVKGVKSLDGLSLSGKVVTVANSSLNKSKVTISNGYTLKLASNVTKSSTKKGSWSYSNSTATYKGSSKTAGYSLASNGKSISYTKATSSKTLATIKGAKSKSGLSLSGKKISLNNSALSKKVTVSGSYEFDFASGYKNATISGTANADTITARGSNLKIVGGKGKDSIKMVGTNQTVSGGDGADTFIYAASGGKEKITDFSSNDTLKIGTSGKGTYSTQTSGKNLIVSTDDGGKITLVGAANLSTPKIAGTPSVGGGVNVSNNGKKITLTEYYSEETFSLTGDYKSAVTVDASEAMLGLNIIGNSYGNKITGSTQNDTIDGGKGNDLLIGGKGSDTLIGGDGDDTLTGGAGSDLFVYKKGSGNDLITDYAVGDRISIKGDTVSDIDYLGKDVVFTLASQNQITVAGSSDRIITYVVGEKTNSYLADVGKYVTFNKNGTSATIKTSYPTSSFQPSNYHNYKNTLVTINGADVTHDLEIIGNNKANVIFGGTQDDTIDGGAGADRISSGDGNDKLFGGKGNDTLNSGIGDDTLWGGEGNDKLYGGDGDDVFYYNTGEGNDTIFGYESGVDKIIWVPAPSLTFRTTEAPAMSFSKSATEKLPSTIWQKKPYSFTILSAK